jgi:hypothetical protein
VESGFTYPDPRKLESFPVKIANVWPIDVVGPFPSPVIKSPYFLHQDGVVPPRGLEDNGPLAS